MKIIVFGLLFGIIGNMVYAQNNCGCESALDKLIVKIEKEYPGFEQKTRDKLLYDNLKTELRGKVKNAGEVNCLEVLNDYLGFFKDKHVWIVSNQINTPSENSNINKPQILDINLKKVQKTIR